MGWGEGVMDWEREKEVSWKEQFPPPHWMPYTNLINCINEKITHEQ